MCESVSIYPGILYPVLYSTVIIVLYFVAYNINSYKSFYSTLFTKNVMLSSARNPNMTQTPKSLIKIELLSQNLNFPTKIIRF